MIQPHIFLIIIFPRFCSLKRLGRDESRAKSFGNSVRDGFICVLTYSPPVARIYLRHPGVITNATNPLEDIDTRLY